MTPGFKVLGRSWCHLCEDMVVALQPFVEQWGAQLIEIDIDEHPELEAQWDEQVPVLLLNDEYVCHYYLDVEALRAKLAAFPVRSAGLPHS